VTATAGVDASTGSLRTSRMSHETSSPPNLRSPMMTSGLTLSMTSSAARVESATVTSAPA
jgi:hypothetical protein